MRHDEYQDELTKRHSLPDIRVVLHSFHDSETILDPLGGLLVLLYVGLPRSMENQVQDAVGPEQLHIEDN